MAVNERTYEMAITTVVAMRQTASQALQWLAPLGADVLPLIAGLQALHDEAYYAGEAMDELAREEFGNKYVSPRFVTLTDAEFKKSRCEESEDAEVPSTHVCAGETGDDRGRAGSASGAGGGG